MLKSPVSSILISLAFSWINVKAETIVPGNTFLHLGHAVYSENGRYFLWMQADGHLVMYRNDGVVRFATHQLGSLAVMQGDGNFVQYTASSQPVWHTHTYANPGAALAVQNDGNLVIYKNGGIPIWSIGSDNTGGNPAFAGDVVGRDKADNIGPVGHLGMWNGSRVVEAGPYGANAIRYTTLSEFKAAGKYWGAATPRIPDYDVFGCFQLRCPNLGISQVGYEVTRSRMAIAKRAYQAFITGADYTIQASWIAAGPSWNTGPLLRGLYRCDTFVLDMLRITVYNINSALNLPIDLAWKDKYDRLENGIRSPTTIFSTLKSY